MIKVAICDDENFITSQIENIILRTCERENIVAEIDVFFSGHGLEKEISDGTRYDLIYLDIQMKDGDGINTAKKIRKLDENALFIYVSGYDKYMIELFRLNVFTFVKKPINAQNFSRLFMDAHEQICYQKIYYSFRYKNEEYKILCMDILYFESNGRRINIHTRDGNIEIFNGKLSEVEDKIKGGKISFLRIHQSYLVNYYHIKSRSKTEITLITGTKLPISEERQKCFGKEYSKLLGSEINV
ncbi:MAG: LytTR family DNA-binding domain-containing protein [Lachnospiraceae bacterium]|nr:LytTR family DNA-binding domain-containing protein [Lachnospiraceae bacterium]